MAAPLVGVEVRRSGRAVPPTVTIGSLGLGLVFLVGLAGPLLVGDRADLLSSDTRGPSSPAHPLGTDALGRDILARTLVAARSTLAMSASATAVAATVGTVIGTLLIVVGRRASGIGQRIIELLISIPPILLAIVVTSVLGPSAVSATLGIGLALTPAFARIANRLALSIGNRDYVAVARQLGVSTPRIVARHVVPNISGPLLVLMSVAFTQAMLALSALSFVGLGVQAPSYDWGSMLGDALRELYVHPIQSVGPIIGIVVTGMLASIVGNGLSGAAAVEARVARAAPTKRSVRTASGPELPPLRDGLQVRQLEVHLIDGPSIVHNVSLDVAPGEIVGLVGESGSGKTLTALALGDLLPPTMDWSADVARLGRHDLESGTRRARIGFIFQEPASAFNPVLRVGTQLCEAARAHRDLSRHDARELARATLIELQLDDPDRILRSYPHELSGGMLQRAMLAMALLTDPLLLIADEPTTALDVTVQAAALRVLRRAVDDRQIAALMISHDLGAVLEVCNRVLIMYAGRVVESLTADLLRSGAAAHPYTRALAAATPRLALDGPPLPLQSIEGRPPSVGAVAPGCAFAARCSLAESECTRTVPHDVAMSDRHIVACPVVTREAVAHGT